MTTTAGLGVKIGLEVHCQLTALKSKLFCSCSSDYRENEPNERVCPVCFGLPGTLPILNRKAVEYATMIALALNCSVAGKTVFYRKNYFYPDLPRNFQISQYDKAGGVPLASGGYIELGKKRIGVRRIQLEEDPGKLTYEGTIDRASYSLVDYNRAGIALVEIVTEPDMTSAKEAKLFLEKLRSTVESLGVSDGELEGAMRCDANVSVEGGNRVEIKNISSFREVEKALNYEILRQGAFSGGGGPSSTETRHWDERRSITISLRLKEEEQDYRYFPEPDLPAVELAPEEVERIRRAMPEVPEVRLRRLTHEYGLPEQAAAEVARDDKVARYFEEASSLYRRPRELANWLVGDFRSSFRDRGDSVKPASLVELLGMIDSGKITGPQAREVLKEMFETGLSASQVVAKRNLAAFSDEAALERTVGEVLTEKAEMAKEAAGNPKVFNYLIGQVLRREPRADPKAVAKLLAKKTK